MTQKSSPWHSVAVEEKLKKCIAEREDDPHDPLIKEFRALLQHADEIATELENTDSFTYIGSKPILSNSAFESWFIGGGADKYLT